MRISLEDHTNFVQETAEEQGEEDMEEDDDEGWETASDEVAAEPLPSNAGGQEDAAASTSQACMQDFGVYAIMHCPAIAFCGLCHLCSSADVESQVGSTSSC